MPRTYDVVLWGATGFTGKLVAEYLAGRYGAARDLRWALGGRSRDKLEKVRLELQAVDPAAKDLPILLGDSDDRASLDRIAVDTRVVCSTVGPYAIHGRELVGACVEAGTDYCDLTGEPTFVRAMVDAHHARAGITGARIVHCCGYDSIPSDLGTLMLEEAASLRHGTRCAEVKYFAGEAKLGISGGTAASMVHLMDEAVRDRGVRRILSDPYSLDPGRPGRGPDGPDQRGVRWDDDVGSWTGPFMMAAINTRVVRRSNALLGYAWGEDFRYSEAMTLGRGPKGWLRAASLSAATAAGMAALAVGPVRRLVADKLLPSPGEGPSKEVRDAGFFVSRLVGVLADGHGKIRGTVRGTSDPGYGETAKMVGESAVCLAKDEGQTRKDGGVLTPASCMGMRLVERLRSVGMTWEIS
jgi:short subunit dehydrogenase-like uncharacterized protein